MSRFLVCLLAVAGVFGICSAVAADTTPLKLTLTTDTNVLFAHPLQLRRATANSPRLDIETARLLLTFTNTSAAPLKVTLFNANLLLLHPHVTGPHPSSVVLQQLDISGEPRRATEEADFTILQPGESKSLGETLSFPGGFSYTGTIVQDYGGYRMHLTYEYLPYPRENNPAATGSWRGVISSNELTFNVVHAGETVNGLQMALDCQPSPAPTSDVVAVTGYVRNVADAPITIRSWDLDQHGLQLYGDNGKEIPFSGGANRSREATPEERVTTIKPGAKHAYPLSGTYYTDKVDTDMPSGTFSVIDKTGFYRYWKVTEGRVFANAVLDMPVGATGEPAWSGHLESPRSEAAMNLTAHRKTLLKKDLSTFVLTLNYSGDVSKPYYSLRLQVPPIEQPVLDPFNPVACLSEKEAAALVDFLAESGILRDAQSARSSTAMQQQPDGYIMTVNGGPHNNAVWTLSLGNLAMHRKLEALRAQLPDDAKKAIDPLLGRLSGQKAHWEGEEALQQPISIDIANGTLGEAVDVVCKAANCHNIVVKIDDFTRKQPMPALQFRAVPVADVFQGLARTADISCTVRANTVKLMPWVR